MKGESSKRLSARSHDHALRAVFHSAFRLPPSAFRPEGSPAAEQCDIQLRRVAASHIRCPGLSEPPEFSRIPLLTAGQAGTGSSPVFLYRS